MAIGLAVVITGPGAGSSVAAPLGKPASPIKHAVVIFPDRWVSPGLHHEGPHVSVLEDRGQALGRAHAEDLVGYVTVEWSPVAVKGGGPAPRGVAGDRAAHRGTWDRAVKITAAEVSQSPTQVG
ncbi:MAG: hypothetical protein M3Y48_01965 [Actinomycetota bacterium]|nr:hypothetical protein [Actinomycetota bacterium]